MRLRTVSVERRGDVFVPTADDTSGGINTLMHTLPPLWQIHEFDVRRHVATSPHTPTGKHDVYWLNHRNGQEVSWTSQEVTTLAKEAAFLYRLQRYLEAKCREMGPTARAYMYLGFTPPRKPMVQEGVVWTGLQSQERLHWHVSEAVPPSHTDGWLQSEKPSDLGKISRFLNLAGERSIELWRNRLENFGQRLTLRQSLDGGQVVERTAFGFPGLAQGYAQVLELRQQVAATWLAHAQSISQIGPGVFTGEMFPLLQSAIPNFAFVLPSEHDRRVLDTTDDSPLWVMPFATAGITEMFASRGLYLDRR